MMKMFQYNALYILLLISSIGFAQKENQYKEEVNNLLNQIVLEIGVDGNLIVNSKTSDASKCSEIFNSKELSLEENKIVKIKIDKPLIKEWDKSYFQNALIVDNREIITAFLNRTNELQEFRDKFGDTVMEFSSPIFLQNYSICILNYSLSYVYGGGFERTAIYKKKDQKWVIIGPNCRANKS